MSEIEVINLMNSHGLIVKSLIFNKLTRISTDSNPSSRNGWYKLFCDTGSINGVFGDYTQSQPGNDSGILAKIPLTFYKLDEKSYQKIQKEIEDRNFKEAERRYKNSIEAANKAKDVWDKCIVPGEFISTIYSIRKHITPYGARFGKSDTLIIPILRTDSYLLGLQVIYPRKGMWGIDSPDKRYYPRGLTKKGGYFVIYGYQTIANIYDPILLCEGYATACSLHEATGFTTYLSFDAGNLINVLKMIRNKYPQKKILICADDDHATKGNPGITHAINCSTSDHDFMVRYIIPNFPFRNVGDKSRTDFNDLHVLYGLEEVNRQIMEAINVF